LIHEIKVKELPAADDEFAKDLGEFDTFEEYKNGIKERLKADEVKKAEAAENDALIEAVVKGTDLKVPDAMIEDEITRNVEDMKHNMAMYGLKFEDYLKYTGSTEEKIRADLKDRAENEVKTGMIMNAIITKEKLVPSADELKAELKKRAGAEDGEKEEDYMKNVNEYELNSLMQRMTFDKLIAFLRANNKIV
jgi:trigger factor